MKLFRLFIIGVAFCAIVTGCASRVRIAEAKSTYATVVGEPRATARVSVQNNGKVELKAVISNEENGNREVKFLIVQPRSYKEQAVTASNISKIELELYWKNNGAEIVSPCQLNFDHTQSVPFARVVFKD